MEISGKRSLFVDLNPVKKGLSDGNSRKCHFFGRGGPGSKSVKAKQLAVGPCTFQLKL